MKSGKNEMFFPILRVWQILKHIARTFHQAQTSHFCRVIQEIAAGSSYLIRPVFLFRTGSKLKSYLIHERVVDPSTHIFTKK